MFYIFSEEPFLRNSINVNHLAAEDCYDLFCHQEVISMRYDCETEEEQLQQAEYFPNVWIDWPIPRIVHCNSYWQYADDVSTFLPEKEFKKVITCVARWFLKF